MHALANQGNVFSSSFFSLLFSSDSWPLTFACLFPRGKISYLGFAWCSAPDETQGGRSIDAGQQEDISHPSRSLIGKKKKRKQQKDKVEKMIIKEQMWWKSCFCWLLPYLSWFMHVCLVSVLHDFQFPYLAYIMHPVVLRTLVWSRDFHTKPVSNPHPGEQVLRKRDLRCYNGGWDTFDSRFLISCFDHVRCNETYYLTWLSPLGFW